MKLLQIFEIYNHIQLYIYHAWFVLDSSFSDLTFVFCPEQDFSTRVNGAKRRRHSSSFFDIGQTWVVFQKQVYYWLATMHFVFKHYFKNILPKSDIGSVEDYFSQIIHCYVKVEIVSHMWPSGRYRIDPYFRFC